MTRNCRKMIKQTGDSLLLSKHSIQFSALFLLLSELGTYIIFHSLQPTAGSPTARFHWIMKIKEEHTHSIANSSLFPTSLYLHSNSTQILALKIKKWFFWKKKIFPKNFFFFFTFFLCNFSVRTLWYFQKNFDFFFTLKKWKNGPQKLLIIGPDPFISQSSPDQRPTAQNWFFILWNLGTRHLFSYLWGKRLVYGQFRFWIFAGLPDRTRW